MLNFIGDPVSALMWCWHQVFGFILGDASPLAWAASIVFLVFTLRAILLKPAINQVRSMRKMQQVAPQMQVLRRKYAGDNQRQTAEMQRLQREHGVNPLGGCLPMLLQIPVLIGLNQVLRGFTQHPHRANYVFSPHDVHSYLTARLLGVHLGDAIYNTSLVIGHAVHHAVWMPQAAPVAIPLIVIAAVATHLTARMSLRHSLTNGTRVAVSTQLTGRAAMWLFPLGVLLFGGALPVGLLLYWVSNNAWTLAQQHFVFQHMDREHRRKPGPAP